MSRVKSTYRKFVSDTELELEGIRLLGMDTEKSSSSAGQNPGAPEFASLEESAASVSVSEKGFGEVGNDDFIPVVRVAIATQDTRKE